MSARGDEIRALHRKHTAKLDKLAETEGLRATLLHRLLTKMSDLYDAKDSKPSEPQPSKIPSKVPVKRIFVEWSEHELKGDTDNITFASWEEFNEAMSASSKLYEETTDSNNYYWKTKIHVDWEDGTNIVDRLDLGGNDWLQSKDGNASIFLQNTKGAYYQSNLGSKDKMNYDFGSAIPPKIDVPKPIPNPEPEKKPEEKKSPASKAEKKPRKPRIPKAVKTLDIDVDPDFLDNLFS